MKTTAEALQLFKERETLYEVVAIARTSASRFIIRGRHLLTKEISPFIVDAKKKEIEKCNTDTSKKP